MEPGSRSSNTAERPASFEERVEEAAGRGLSGWDFSFLDGRWCEDAPSWDYRELVLGRLGAAGSLLDLGTGGGELLATLSPLPADVCATEGYAPNLPTSCRKGLPP